MVARTDLKPQIWGPLFWGMLHAAADGATHGPLTPEEQEAWSGLLDALPVILPCGRCRTNLREKYAEGLRPGVQTSDALRFGLFDLHNAVNRATHQPEMTTLDNRSYTRLLSSGDDPSGGAGCPNEKRLRITCILLVVVVIILTIIMVLQQCSRPDS